MAAGRELTRSDGRAAAALCALFVASGCAAPATCDRAGCDAADAPVPAPSIDEGIAGVAASQSDACAAVNGGEPCCACPLSTATLTVFPTPTFVDDPEQAAAIVRAEEGAIVVAIDETYERALEPATYLACRLGGAAVCAPFRVRAGEVTSVHVVVAFGPGRIQTFSGGAAGPPSFAVDDRRE